MHWHVERGMVGESGNVDVGADIDLGVDINVDVDERVVDEYVVACTVNSVADG